MVRGRKIIRAPQDLEAPPREPMPELPQKFKDEAVEWEHRMKEAKLELKCKEIVRLRTLYEKRAELGIPDKFWCQVFLHGPPEVAEYIMSGDAIVLRALEKFEVQRPEVGEPRSLRFIFTFSKDRKVNPFIKDEVIEKEFFWRTHTVFTSDGRKRTYEGLVSEPVRIRWRKDMDITGGVLKAACDLFDAEKASGEDRKNLPEYTALMDKLAIMDKIAGPRKTDLDPSRLDGQTNPAFSFFNFFGYRGGDVTAEQSANAIKEENEKIKKIGRGEPVGDEDEAHEDEDVEDDFASIEIFPDGSDLATALADDLWPNALKYYAQSFEDAALPGTTAAPGAIAAHGTTTAPDATAAPETTTAPDATTAPETTTAPEAAAAPGTATAPEATDAPEATAVSEASNDEETRPRKKVKVRR